MCLVCVWCIIMSSERWFSALTLFFSYEMSNSDRHVTTNVYDSLWWNSGKKKFFLSFIFLYFYNNSRIYTIPDTMRSLCTNVLFLFLHKFKKMPVYLLDQKSMAWTPVIVSIHKHCQKEDKNNNNNISIINNEKFYVELMRIDKTR